MSNSGFLDEKPLPDGIERLAPQGGTSEAFIVKADGKNLFMKRLRPEFAGDTSPLECVASTWLLFVFTLK